MNKQEFEQAIAKIGWSIQKSWNGLNDKLVSPSGAVTDIRVREDKLEPFSNKLYGCESNNISAVWYLKDVEYNEKEGYVAINHLLLMNHDKK